VWAVMPALAVAFELPKRPRGSSDFDRCERGHGQLGPVRTVVRSTLRDGDRVVQLATKQFFLMTLLDIKKSKET
jgi:hypothetical protein